MSERDRRAVIWGAALLCGIAVYFGLIEPGLSKYEQAAKAHDLAASNLAHRLAQRQKRVYQSQQVIDWEQKWSKLGSPKPYNEGVTTVGSEIVAASQSSGAQLQGATPGAPSPWPDDPQLQQSIFQIEAKANWENVFKFIAALYRIDGVVSVENLDLTGGDAKSQGMMNLRLSVSVLLQGEKGGGGKWLR